MRSVYLNLNRVALIPEMSSKPDSKEKRISTAFDSQDRGKHVGLLAFSGFETVGSGSISVLKLHEMLLKNFPEILQQFPAYKGYITLSTWTAFIGGLLFMLFPVTLTVWIAHYLIAMSLAYMILAARGIVSLSPVAFHVAYWLTIAVPILVRLGDMTYYIKKTKLDFYIYLLMSVGLVAWAAYEVNRV